MFLETKGIINQKKNSITNTDIIEMNTVFLPEMNCELIPFYSVNGKRILPFWVEISQYNNGMPGIDSTHNKLPDF